MVTARLDEGTMVVVVGVLDMSSWEEFGGEQPSKIGVEEEVQNFGGLKVSNHRHVGMQIDY